MQNLHAGVAGLRHFRWPCRHQEKGPATRSVEEGTGVSEQSWPGSHRPKLRSVGRTDLMGVAQSPKILSTTLEPHVHAMHFARVGEQALSY